LKKQIVESLPAETGLDEKKLRQYLLKKFGFDDSPKIFIQLSRRSIDARHRDINVLIEATIYIDEEPDSLLSYRKNYLDVRNSGRVVIVGSGPAGMFAALRFLELGIKPVILERGKNVRERRRDIAAINKQNTVNPDSNYCFGEGGAGTYSDGKLYTRSKKRGNIRRILEIFVAHNANPDILVESHPHIGTNKLPDIVTNIRNSILEAGGEFHFNSRVSDLIIDDGELRGVIDQDGNQYKGEAVILAAGHSARDIYYLLSQYGITLQSKPFALGARIEHPQELIDKIQYHCDSRGNLLPPASYSLATQVVTGNNSKGVFSFCMCPGGFIVPAATAPGEIVVNGMSPSRRDSKFANSGIVVAIDDEDLAPFTKSGIFAGIEYQKFIEQRAFSLAGGTQSAPAQRMVDFINGKNSSDLPGTSYQPGVVPVQLSEVFPDPVTLRLRQALGDFGKKMKGYLTNEAQLVGVESRTSSPVRIPRDNDSMEHINLKRLYPAGEGAGYAGGIASAAMDGQKCAEKIAMKYFNLEG
jgi:uncharacterized FAD-dependent dehydrogenase